MSKSAHKTYPSKFRWGAVFSSILLFVNGTSIAFAGTITADTVIDSASPFHETAIQVIDGTGPTTVRVVDGGSVVGFEVGGSSHIILDGGESTLLSGLSGESMLTILSGKIDCTESVCSVIDYDALLTATGNSSIVVMGMFEGADIRLADSSTLTVYGENLSTSESGGEILVRGTLLDGFEFFGNVKISGDPTDRIILKEIPEPHSVVLAVLAFMYLAISKRGYSKQLLLL